VNYARETGGWLCLQDLKEHCSEWVKPLKQNYGALTLYELPPNGQGAAALMALAILKEASPVYKDPFSLQAVHFQIEAMKLAFDRIFRHLADPEFMTLSCRKLLDKTVMRKLASKIHPEKVLSFSETSPREKGTVYLATADAEGMMVSFIQSNYQGFGSGLLPPDTGIALHNRGAGFNTIPGHPNCLAPGKRPFHSIIPAFANKAGKPWLAFGVMGGHMQAQGHLQILLSLADGKKSLQEALDAPRWFVCENFDLSLEEAFPSSLREGLARIGHRIVEKPYWTFGGGQMIEKMEKGYLAVSDWRKDGVALAY
jgi:gamma-glutamyltranspeptidase/glutathione hydrolase